jgi:hypothetical protein
MLRVVAYILLYFVLNIYEKKVVSDIMSNLICPSKQNHILEVSAEVKIETAVLRFMTLHSLGGYQRTFG